MRSICTVFVGPGRVGGTLYRALRDTPGEWRLTGGPRPSRRAVAGADVIVLAVPDGAIRATAERIAPWLHRGACVLHCAGSRSPAELEACRAAGARIGAMHPLASFASRTRPPDLRGVCFVTAGDAKAVAAVRRMVRPLGAWVLVAPVHGPAYHALAALVAGGSVGFVHATIPVLERLGLARRDAERAAAGLIRTVAGNIAQIGLPAALTGPVIRGDAEAVAAHRAALRALSPEIAAAYDAVAPLVLGCAIAAGLEPGKVADMREAMGAGAAEDAGVGARRAVR